MIAGHPRLGVAGIVLGLALLFQARPGYSDTFLVMHSQPDDYVGQGLRYRFTEADGTFSGRHQPDSVELHFGGNEPSETWDVGFAAPKGAELRPGVYEEAARFVAQSPTSPGLGVDGEGRGCSRVKGRFVIFEAQYAGDGQVLRFAADFEQHCEGGDALFGTIAINSTLPTPAPPPPTPVAAPDSTFLLVDSDPGDFIGGGVRDYLTLADGTLALSHSFGTLHVVFSVGPSEQWKVYLSAPSGGDLVPGVYERATRWPFGDSTGPQLAASRNSNECNMLSGRFVIHTAEYGPGGDVSRFFGEFEQHCENGPAALRGTLRVNFPCTGDCSGDAIVTIDELLEGVAISAGKETLDRCRAFDHDANGTVSVDELVRAVGAALTGCQ